MVGVISSGSPLHLKANPIAAKILLPPLVYRQRRLAASYSSAWERAD
jgi:hypothetical protein